MAILPTDTQLKYYKYEIHAPGHISVNKTFEKKYKHKKQEEICFPNGIANRYIRCCVIIIKLYEIIVCNIVRYCTILTQLYAINLIMIESHD